MKFNFKSFMVGMLTMVVIVGSGITAFGVSSSKNITVQYNDIKLIVDEKQITPKDASGNVVEPFVYNGTTYLPVRAIGEALGKDVNWDAATKTVVVGKYDKPESLYPDIKLEKLDYLNESDYYTSTKSVKDNFGNGYNGYCTLGNYSGDDAFVEYALDGKYSKLKGCLILNYDHRTSNSTAMYSIKVDGKTVKTLNAVQSSERPIDFEIDLTNSNILRIEAVGVKSYLGNLFVDMGLYK